MNNTITYEQLEKANRKAFLAWKRKHVKLGESSWTFDDYPQVCIDFANHPITVRERANKENARFVLNN